MKQTDTKEMPTIRLILPNGSSRHLTIMELGLMAGCALRDAQQDNPEVFDLEVSAEGLRLIGEAAIQIVENEDYSVDETMFDIDETEVGNLKDKQSVVLH